MSKSKTKELNLQVIWERDIHVHGVFRAKDEVFTATETPEIKTLIEHSYLKVI